MNSADPQIYFGQAHGVNGPVDEYTSTQSQAHYNEYNQFQPTAVNEGISSITTAYNTHNSQQEFDDTDMDLHSKLNLNSENVINSYNLPTCNITNPQDGGTATNYEFEVQNQFQLGNNGEINNSNIDIFENTNLNEKDEVSMYNDNLDLNDSSPFTLDSDLLFDSFNLNNQHFEKMTQTLNQNMNNNADFGETEYEIYNDFENDNISSINSNLNFNQKLSLESQSFIYNDLTPLTTTTSLTNSLNSLNSSKILPSKSSSNSNFSITNYFHFRNSRNSNNASDQSNSSKQFLRSVFNSAKNNTNIAQQQREQQNPQNLEQGHQQQDQRQPDDSDCAIEIINSPSLQIDKDFHNVSNGFNEYLEDIPENETDEMENNGYVNTNSETDVKKNKKMRNLFKFKTPSFTPSFDFMFESEKDEKFEKYEKKEEKEKDNLVKEEEKNFIVKSERLSEDLIPRDIESVKTFDLENDLNSLESIPSNVSSSNISNSASNIEEPDYAKLFENVGKRKPIKSTTKKTLIGVSKIENSDIEIDLESLDLPSNITIIENNNVSRRGRKESGEFDSSKIFHCKFCSRSFKRQEHLKRHFRSLHTFEKPYHCKICNKKFSRSDNLNQHVKTHKNEN